jgi:hypothetical protein
MKITAVHVELEEIGLSPDICTAAGHAYRDVTLDGDPLLFRILPTRKCAGRVRLITMYKEGTQQGEKKVSAHVRIIARGRISREYAGSSDRK